MSTMSAIQGQPTTINLVRARRHHLSTARLLVARTPTPRVPIEVAFKSVANRTLLQGEVERVVQAQPVYWKGFALTFAGLFNYCR